MIHRHYLDDAQRMAVVDWMRSNVERLLDVRPTNAKLARMLTSELGFRVTECNARKFRLARIQVPGTNLVLDWTSRPAKRKPLHAQAAKAKAKTLQGDLASLEQRLDRVIQLLCSLLGSLGEPIPKD